MNKDTFLICGKEVRRIREVDTRSLDFNDDPVVLARVAVDAKPFKEPLIKIDFSTIIQVISPDDVNTVGAIFNLELRRDCNGVAETLKSYQYIVDVREGDNQSPGYNVRDSFTFTYCDKDLLCNMECCIYTVELISIEVNFTGPVEPSNELIIEDSFIRAIVQDIDNCNWPPNSHRDFNLACGREVQRVALANISPAFELSNPYILARITLDVECLNKPIVKIDFSTMIEVSESAEASDEDFTSGIQLIFELRRKCDGVDEVLREYKFVRDLSTAGGANGSSYRTRNSFSINYCDDIHCNKKCCIYTVVLVGLRVVGLRALEELIIEDSAINALAQELCV
jgi:hypothetical protein